MPKTYTLEQIAEMGWLSPKEAKQLRARLAKAEDKVALLRRRNRNEVRTEDMLKELQRLGFVEMHGSWHRALEDVPSQRIKLLHHPESGLMLTLPTVSEIVPPIYVAAIETQLDNFGLKRKGDW